MKRLMCFVCLIAAILISGRGAAADAALYTASARLNVPIYQSPDENAATVGRVREGETVDIYSFDPSWVYLSCNSIKGYVLRAYLTGAEVIDERSTPPFGVEVNRYAAVIGRETAVRTAIGAGETLATLQAGAKVSFICIENGWGKLVYFRQYAYINTNDLSELVSVCPDTRFADGEAPIAAFTTFYIPDSDDETVRGKEVNIAINCASMSEYILKAGKTLDYNQIFGPFSRYRGYVKGPVLVNGGWGLGYGGGVCQVSSTLYNVILQLPGINVTERRSHGTAGAAYLPVDMDAAVGAENINFCMRNGYGFSLRFDAYAQDGALYIALYRADN